MNKSVVAALVTVAVTILTPVGVGVNSPSVNNPAVWVDGSGSPVPPIPVLCVDGSGSPVPPMPVLLADGSGSPVPPMPVSVDENGKAAQLGSSTSA